MSRCDGWFLHEFQRHANLAGELYRFTYYLERIPTEMLQCSAGNINQQWTT